jgi:hypothetical protein
MSAARGRLSTPLNVLGVDSHVARRAVSKNRMVPE